MERAIDYKTHILIGVRENGRHDRNRGLASCAQTDRGSGGDRHKRNGYVTFLLCTPTSIMPAGGHSGARESGYGLLRRR
jgi:hypothetical protein